MNVATAIQANGLSKTYGKTHALEPTSLAVPQGSIFALLGHNGAGKTTLLKLLMNILHPTSGSATVLDRASSELAGDDFTRVGYVSENQELPGWMTVGNFLRYQSGFYPQWDDADLIRRFDLPLGRKLKHLSRGQRMKAALASVLAFRPALIVLDEPFSGLDPLVRDELIEALLDTAATQSTTILLSSHDLAEIESFATHVAFLHGGSLLFTEEMPTLSSRFREVTVTLENVSPATPENLSSSAPHELSSAPQNLSSFAKGGGSASPATDSGVPSPTSRFPEPSGSGLIPAPEPGFSPSGMPSSAPPQHPPTWLQLQHTAHTVRFIHTQADTESIAQQVRTLYPTAIAIDIEPMNLRSIFLAIAKSGRAIEGGYK